MGGAEGVEPTATATTSYPWPESSSGVALVFRWTSTPSRSIWAIMKFLNCFRGHLKEG